MAITASELHEALEEIAPLRHAESWDNTGELISGVTSKVERVLLTIDLTEPVLAEAIDANVDSVIAYHPPIFSPLQRIDAGTPTGRITLGAIRAGLHVYSPHTALDATPGGVNDWLADCFGSGDRRALEQAADGKTGSMCKIVTFCPQDSVDTIRDGLAAVGAGTIGEYKRCSFELAGTGTFHGSSRSQPNVGTSGRLERVGEVRLEMVCPSNALGGAVRALRSFHPYEEPPVDIYALEPAPLRETGAGRRVVLDRSVSMRTLVDRVRSRTSVKRLQVARSHERPQKHRIIGVCVGAGGSMLDTAISQGCTVFVTGEMRHHDVLKAQASGCSVILAGHTNTERGYLPVLAKRLAASLGSDAPEFIVSRKDRDPLRTS
ncbi:MAG: Nif3-like dinuclear metal center hexameric protein [Phycisphaerales bacterium]|nr:Nif3-like dinuclear metal center hexameric protein [Phycisphaerales bacterium]